MRRIGLFLGGIALPSCRGTQRRGPVEDRCGTPAKRRRGDPAEDRRRDHRRYVKTIGGMEKLEADQDASRRAASYTSGGGFEAKVVEESKRPDMVRQELVLQGMTGITA